MNILSKLIDRLGSGIAKPNKKNEIDIDMAKKYLDEAAEGLLLGMDSLMLGMGGACSMNFHMCIDKCCAAIYSLFLQIPSGFGDRAGQQLKDLCETKLQSRDELSPEALKSIESVARIGINWGSAAMYRISTSQLSNVNLLRQLSDAAAESIRCTRNVLDILDTEARIAT